MASQKLFSAVLLAAIALASAGVFEPSSNPKHLIVGNDQPGARLLQRDNVKEDATLWGGKATVTKTFPGDGSSQITEVRALDQHQNGHGATATVLAGGPGFKYITIKFESENFRGIDFVVEVYGK